MFDAPPKDYEVIDTGDGEPERWQDVILRLPDLAGHLAQTAARTVDARRRTTPPFGQGRRRVGVFQKLER